jgi:hypothetical protein
MDEPRRVKVHTTSLVAVFLAAGLVENGLLCQQGAVRLFSERLGRSSRDHGRLPPRISQPRLDAMSTPEHEWTWPWLSVEDGSLWADASPIRTALWNVIPPEVEGVDLVIETLHISAGMRSDLEREIQLLVAEARSREVPWSVIGKHFGITRQAAQQRFGAPMNTDTIRRLTAERKEALERAKWRVEDRGKRDESFWEARQLIDRLGHFRA